jgi:hypothetical protein
MIGYKMNNDNKETTFSQAKFDPITESSRVYVIADTLAQIGIERQNQEYSEAIEEAQKAERARKRQQKNIKLDQEVREWKQRTEDDRRARETQFDEPPQSNPSDKLDIQFNKFRKGSTLTLSNQNIRDDKIPSICEYLDRHHDITAFDLKNNRITYKGAILLAANQTLTSLNLDNNRIANEGLTALANNKTLSSLSLKNNRFDIEGVTSFVFNETLVSLNLDDNGIGNEGAAAPGDNKTLSNHLPRMNRHGMLMAPQFSFLPSMSNLIMHNILRNISVTNRNLQEAYRETVKKELLVVFLGVNELVFLVQGYIPKFLKTIISEELEPVRPALKDMPSSNASSLFLPSIKINLVNDQKQLMQSCEIFNSKKCTQFMAFVALVSAPLLCRVPSEKAEFELNLGILSKIQKENPGATGEVAGLLGIQEEKLRQLTEHQVNFSMTQ